MRKYFAKNQIYFPVSHFMLFGQWNELFAWLPVETVVYENQQGYYDALAISQKSGNSMFLTNSITLHKMFLVNNKNNLINKKNSINV